VTVLGIDPGTASCGYGVVIEKGGRLRAVDFGCWKTTASQRPEERLLKIHDEVVDLIERYDPRAVALEESFVGVDARTALSVGQARGAVVVAAALAGVECAEYALSHVKLAVCGYGRAEKAQVQRMVQAILRLDAPPQALPARGALQVNTRRFPVTGRAAGRSRAGPAMACRC
jgi:crossover junction endodeoxyribonuclease RuvC